MIWVHAVLPDHGRGGGRGQKRLQRLGGLRGIRTDADTVDWRTAYLWLELPRNVQFRFINVNLVEATNRFSHFQFIGTSAFVFFRHASI